MKVEIVCSTQQWRFIYCGRLCFRRLESHILELYLPQVSMEELFEIILLEFYVLDDEVLG